MKLLMDLLQRKNGNHQRTLILKNHLFQTESGLSPSFLNPDTCNQYTFIKQFKGQNSYLTKDLLVNPDGSYVVVGKTNFGAGSPFIFKFDNTGNILWKKSFTSFDGAAPEIFNSVFSTMDGGYICTGHSRSYSIIFYKFKSSGELEWFKAYKSNTATNLDGIAIQQAADQSYYYTAKEGLPGGKNDCVVGNISNSGALLWTKKYHWGDNNTPTSILVNPTEIWIAGQVTSLGGFVKSGFLTTIKPNDGTVNSFTTYGISGKELSFQDIQKNITGYSFSFLLSDPAGANTTGGLLKIDNTKVLQWAKEFNPGNFNDIINHCTTLDGGFLVTQSATTSFSDSYIYKLDNNGNFKWQRKYGDNGYQRISNVKELSDSSILLSGIASSAGGIPNDWILQIKTNKNGNLNTCQLDPVSATQSIRNFSVNSVLWSVSDFSAVIDTYTNTELSEFPQPLITCSGTGCNSNLNSDSCSLPAFQKIFELNGFMEAGGLVVTKKNDYVIGGRCTPFVTPATGESFAFLAGISKSGNLNWQKRLGWANTGAVTLNKLISTQDSCIAGIGNFANAPQTISNGNFLIKFKTDGTLLWKIDFQPTSNGELFVDILQTSDQGYLLCGPSLNSYLVIRLDKNGNRIWSRLYSSSNYQNVNCMVEVNGNIYLTGFGYDNFSNTQFNTLTKITLTDGSVQWSKTYGSTTAPSEIRLDKIAYSNNKLIATGVYGMQFYPSQPDKLEQAMFQFDLDGNLLKFYRLPHQTPKGVYSDNIINRTTLDEKGELGGQFENNDSSDITIFRMKDFGIIEWQKKFSHAFKQTIKTIATTSDSGFIALGTSGQDFPNNSGLYLIKAQKDGTTIQCDTIEGDLQSNAFAITQGSTTMNSSDLPIVSSPFFSISEFSLQLQENRLCPLNIQCDSLKIKGSDSICQTTTPVNYVLNRNTNCRLPYTLLYDTSIAALISKSDSGFQFKYRKKGSMLIKVVLSENCKIISDSLKIAILSDLPPLDLGNGFPICPGNRVPLHAGPGFKSYLWQSGTTDSIFIAEQPGLYHVTVSDFCNTIFKDSIQLTAGIQQPLTLGPDTSICVKDTLVLTATGGFQQYSWSPDYALIAVAANQIKVHPEMDTSYIVQAIQSLGCKISDTIRIIIKQSPLINLGNDTSICKFDSLALDAGQGFLSYQWNTGSTASIIKAGQAGLYYVTVRGTNLCYASDSMRIISQYPLPPVNLGPDMGICINQDKVLDAGNFITYLWQDSSANKTFTTRILGDYWVTVRDINGCKNTDSIKLTRYLPTPNNFLPKNAEICFGQSLVLQASTGFISYKWFNNTTASSTKVNSPGIYSLQVVDINGCTTIDSINVKGKDCPKGIYFPNAFTPNNDRSNDLFKPVVYGILDEFYMAVYNRYGQKIYETRDATKGWDGFWKGQAQASNTFAWSARYKFSGAGEGVHVEKGTVTLVR